MPTSIKIRYLSHGIVRTGGSIYEEILSEHLKNSLIGKDNEVEFQHLHIDKIYKNLSNILLFFQAFRKSNATINLVVIRIAVSAILRNLLTKNKVLIIIHNYDKSDYKSIILKWYFKLLFSLLKKVPGHRFGIIVVAPFWKDFFSRRFPNLNVFMFPNLFKNEEYKEFRKSKKRKRVHLNQLSPKNDNKIFEVAEKLSKYGYDCYFTTLIKEQVAEYEHYSIKSQKFKQYLEEMAESEYTLALTYINEGWNRIAHESLLVGTPVIGYDKGGLGDLLKESASKIVKSSEEVLEVISQNPESKYVVPEEFFEKYDYAKGVEYIKPITDFILNK